MTVNLFLTWPKYRLFPYEKIIAVRETKALLEPIDFLANETGIQLLTNHPSSVACQLTYFSTVTEGERVIKTTQARLESSGSNGNGNGRQSTRYSVHGMHEYKGKFNPQVARAVLNHFRLSPNAQVLDPFCGSGTTIVESSHKRLRATGLDINPLAIYIASAKLLALRTPASKIETGLRQTLRRLRCGKVPPDNTPRFTYLKSWFSDDILQEIEALKYATESEDDKVAHVLKVIISDLLRDYSLQEPFDLRIRRRTTPLPTVSLVAAFEMRTQQFLGKLKNTQAVFEKVSQCRVVKADVTNIPKPLFGKIGRFDAVISSPPYATALPYIDTQRLSLVWLGLCQPSEIMRLQSELIGSREFSGKQKSELAVKMPSNTDQLAKGAYAFCAQLQKAVSPNDGFRRQSVPRLLYRYLVGMQKSLRTLFHLTNPGAKAAFILGHNHTVIGGKRYDIDTPSLLTELIKGSGFIDIEAVPLETYQRYGIHYKNAVSKEELILFRRR